jgi:uncharacterized protein DUF6286
MRILNRFLAFILALAVLAVCIVVIVEVIGYAINGEHVIVDWMSWQRWAERTHFDSTVVKVLSIIFIVVGLILLLAELKPRRVTRVNLESDEVATDAAITTKGIAVVARTATADVEGISTASASASPRRVAVTATAAERDKAHAQTLTAPVTAAVQTRLDSLRMQRHPRLSVRVKPRSR